MDNNHVEVQERVTALIQRSSIKMEETELYSSIPFPIGQGFGEKMDQKEL